MKSYVYCADLKYSIFGDRNGEMQTKKSSCHLSFCLWGQQIGPTKNMNINQDSTVKHLITSVWYG